MPSLNTFQPEAAPHGVEITLTAKGPQGDYVVLAEVFDMSWDEENMVEQLPVMGSRITGSRWGRYKASGVIKAYWVNMATHSMWFGATVPNQAGSASSIYHSKIPFTRYNVRVQVANPGSGFVARTFVNCVFSKDVSQWNADKFTEETVDFVCEDILEA